MRIIEYNRKDMFTELLKLKPNLDLQDSNNETALMYTIKEDRIIFFRELLKHIPKPNLDLQNSNNETSLMLAIKLNRNNMIKELQRYMKK
jgi:ankyrin repeat protein